MTTEFYGLEPGGLLPTSALKQLDTARRGLIGTGRPDVPATTPYTATQLNALPVGTEYRSTDGPQGAWKWRKTGATIWTVTDGDTGWRNISASLINGWTGDSLRLRRVNEAVYLVSIYSSNGLSGSASTSFVFVATPDGYRAGPASAYNAVGSWVSVADSVTGGTRVALVGQPGGSLGLRPSNLANITGSSVWSTDAQWPTALPGTAA